jgi:hypothetical protein
MERRSAEGTIKPEGEAHGREDAFALFRVQSQDLLHKRPDECSGMQSPFFILFL